MSTTPGPDTGRRRAGHVGARAFDEELMAALLDEWARLPADQRRRHPLRSRLIMGHLPVARNVASRYSHWSEDQQDLEQVAVVGLIGAVDRFRPERGGDFLPFAIPTITGQLRHHFRDRTATIRVPRRTAELRLAVHHACAELEQRLGRPARTQEVAHRLDVDASDVRAVRSVAAWGRCDTLDLPSAQDGPGDDPRIVASDRRDIVEIRHDLAPLLARLPERERHIIALRFLGDLTQVQIGRRLGMSQMHVSRLIIRSLAFLREAMREADGSVHLPVSPGRGRPNPVTRAARL